jgi:membrane fusion protein (multidrug efflux system)
MAKDSVKAIREEMASLTASISALDADIAQLKRDRERFKELYQQKAVAKRRFEVIETKLKAKTQQKNALVQKEKARKAQLASSKRGVELAVADEKRVEETKAAIATLTEKIKALEAKLEDTRLNLQYCRLKSPLNGTVAKKYVSIGDVVAPGRPVYALVNPKDIYILVLLEETKLKGVVPGSPAKIKIDALPKEEYEGVVDKILPTSAAKFALVPRDISAGEFTKVVQRMQVKVKITKGDVSKLLIGMGGEIEIKRKR